MNKAIFVPLNDQIKGDVGNAFGSEWTNAAIWPSPGGGRAFHLANRATRSWYEVRGSSSGVSWIVCDWPSLSLE